MLFLFFKKSIFLSKKYFYKNYLILQYFSGKIFLKSEEQL